MYELLLPVSLYSIIPPLHNPLLEEQADGGTDVRGVRASEAAGLTKNKPRSCHLWLPTYLSGPSPTVCIGQVPQVSRLQDYGS